MIAPPADDPAAVTRIDCATTRGYNVKRGLLTYDYCPFCGHCIEGDDDHEITVTIDS